MAFEQQIYGEIRAAQRGHDIFSGVDVAITDRIAAAPTENGARRIGGIGAQGGWVGERDHQMPPRPHDAM